MTQELGHWREKKNLKAFRVDMFSVFYDIYLHSKRDLKTGEYAQTESQRKYIDAFVSYSHFFKDENSMPTDPVEHLENAWFSQFSRDSENYISDKEALEEIRYIKEAIFGLYYLKTNKPPVGVDVRRNGIDFVRATANTNINDVIELFVRFGRSACENVESSDAARLIVQDMIDVADIIKPDTNTKRR